MLTVKERKRVLIFFHYCSILCLFPVRVHVQSWDIRTGKETKGKVWLCRGSYGLFIAHALYKFIRLLYAIIFCPQVPLPQIMIHGDLAFGSMTAVYWYYIQYIDCADVNAGFVRMTLTGNIAGARGEKGSMIAVTPTDEGEKDPGHLWERSLQDQIAIVVPFMPPLVAMFIAVCIFFDPTMKMLLFSALPSQYQNAFMFSICFLEECRFIMFIIGLAVPSWQLQVIGFDLINKRLQDILSAMETGFAKRRAYIGDYIQEMRHLQLYITALNVVHRNFILTWKLLSLGMSITSGYAAIAHFSEYPVFGVMFYLLVFDAVFIYSVMYEKAFKVPDLMAKARSALSVHVRTLPTSHEAQRNCLARQLRSIPSVGIEVGKFHMMERTSTPVFLDFVLSNIVNMLVSFK